MLANDNIRERSKTDTATENSNGKSIVSACNVLQTKQPTKKEKFHTQRIPRPKKVEKAAVEQIFRTMNMEAYSSHTSASASASASASNSASAVSNSVASSPPKSHSRTSPTPTSAIHSRSAAEILSVPSSPPSTKRMPLSHSSSANDDGPNSIQRRRRPGKRMSICIARGQGSTGEGVNQGKRMPSSPPPPNPNIPSSSSSSSSDNSSHHLSERTRHSNVSPRRQVASVSPRQHNQTLSPR